MVAATYPSWLAPAALAQPVLQDGVRHGGQREVRAQLVQGDAGRAAAAAAAAPALVELRLPYPQHPAHIGDQAVLLNVPAC